MKTTPRLPQVRDIERRIAEHEELIGDAAWAGGLVVGGVVLSVLGQWWAGVPALVAGAWQTWQAWQDAKSE